MKYIWIAPSNVKPEGLGQALTVPEKGAGSKYSVMATNPPAGDGHRNGAVRQRSQVQNPITGLWVKRDKNTGKFMDNKMNGKPFKGVRKEKK